MIELLETPTFVVDDLFDCKNIKLFDYLTHEKVDYEVLELCSAELSYREIVYYPVVVNDITDPDLFKLVNVRAMEMAFNHHLIIVFLYDGYEDVVTTARLNLLERITEHNLSLDVIRFVCPIKPAELIPPFVFFPFAEIESNIEILKQDHYYGINEYPRKKIFTCDVSNDTPHGRVLGASIWYHALHENAYFNYPERILDKSIINSDTYKWSDQFSSTATLIDMFGQQLPMTTHCENQNDYYDQSYWNFVMHPKFQATNLSVSSSLFSSIVNFQPFIVVGPTGSLRLLRSMGYKTFKAHVNEDYDRITNDEQRMFSLFRLLYELVNFSDEELRKLNEQLIPILKHNYNHFVASKRFRLINLLESLKFPNI